MTNTHTHSQPDPGEPREERDSLRGRKASETIDGLRRATLGNADRALEGPSPGPH